MKTKTKIKQKIGNEFVNVKSAKKATVRKSNTLSVNPLLQALVEEDNKALTENGAETFKSSLNAVLDLFALGAALRTRTADDVIKLFTKALNQDKLLTLKCLFNIRNIRGGAGERKVFRTILRYLGDNYKDLIQKNLDNIAFFGRYDDIYSLFGTKSEALALEYLRVQLNQDVENYNNDKGISLLSKWLASENTSSKETRDKGAKIRAYLGWSSKQYRKTLSALRSYSNVVEVKMSANEWADINYSAVPSKASLNYKKAFKKHDAIRYNSFIESVKKGEAKINASALFPYEIAAKVFAGDQSETLDVLWDALSLALYTSEKNTGPFGGYFITFSAKPELQKVVGSNIREKIMNISRAQWDMNTNLQAVFDLVLTNALKSKAKQKDMPAQILIISDMEFDCCGPMTNFQTIEAKYKSAGYEIPQIVFWNVNSRQNNVPVTADKQGVLLVSGASPSVFKTLLSGKQYTPIDQMLETLNSSQYDKVLI